MRPNARCIVSLVIVEKGEHALAVVAQYVGSAAVALARQSDGFRQLEPRGRAKDAEQAAMGHALISGARQQTVRFGFFFLEEFTCKVRGYVGAGLQYIALRLGHTPFR